MANKCEICAELDNLMVCIEAAAGDNLEVRPGMLFQRSHPIVKRIPRLFARWLDGEEGIVAALNGQRAKSTGLLSKVLTRP